MSIVLMCNERRCCWCMDPYKGGFGECAIANTILDYGRFAEGTCPYFEGPENKDNLSRWGIE